MANKSKAMQETYVNFSKFSYDEKLGYLASNINRINTDCVFYAKLLENYIDQAKTDYVPFIKTFTPNDIRKIMTYLHPDRCHGNTHNVIAWLLNAFRLSQHNLRPTPKPSPTPVPKPRPAPVPKPRPTPVPKKTSGKSEPKKTSGKSEPKKTSGKSEPKKTSGKSEPKKSSGKSEPKKTSGKSEPKKSSGKSEPKKTSGKSEPKKSSGKSEPKKSSGKSEPKKSSGKSEPKKTSSINDGCFTEMSNDKKLNYLHDNLNHMNVNCEFYAVLLEHYIYAVKTNYIPFTQTFNKTDVNNMFNYLNSDDKCPGDTSRIVKWLRTAYTQMK